MRLRKKKKNFKDKVTLYHGTKWFINNWWYLKTTTQSILKNGLNSSGCLCSIFMYVHGTQAFLHTTGKTSAGFINCSYEIEVP